MDRLSALIVLAALGACDDTKPAGDPPSRVNAAKTTQTKGATVESFCDVYATPDKAPKLVWPVLAATGVAVPGGAEAPPAPAAGWRWINIWATWCKPCVEEMPRLVKWQAKLGGPAKLDLAFVSVDESADAIATFKKSHPDTPTTLRLADSKTQETWFTQLGLAGAPPIPIHVFVDAQQRVRCVRAGGVRDQDYAIIEKLLAP
ncbi:MAG: TlpA family protein disulfide reductase [Deltaproteobacteria bacterium]|nr:TlpA family protein disulfide reductase [Deltaproteobacteria bacterium]